MGQRSFDLILIISTTIRYHSQLHKLYSHKIILLDFQQAQRPFNSQQVPFDQLRVNHLFQSHPLRGCQPNSLRSIRKPVNTLPLGNREVHIGKDPRRHHEARWNQPMARVHPSPHRSCQIILARGLVVETTSPRIRCCKQDTRRQRQERYRLEPPTHKEEPARHLDRAEQSGRAGSEVGSR
jgi:hypothetical protein